MRQMRKSRSEIAVGGRITRARAPLSASRLTAAIVLAIFCSVTTASVAAEEAQIAVHADHAIGRVSPYTTGACIEDVNHEIYGGIYSQMIFGESFQEPATRITPKGFTAYGGEWQAANGKLSAAAGEGPKLIVDGHSFRAGDVSVEILFSDKQPGNAGLILDVDQPGIGADRFVGYEVSLDPAGSLVLGRHRNNWEPIKNVPCPVPPNQWIKLSVRLGTRTLDIEVDGHLLLHYQDREHPLPAGRIGLRTWQRTARFRNLELKQFAGQKLSGVPPQIAFEPDPDAALGKLSGMWRPVHHGGAKGSLAVDSVKPFTGVQSQRITFADGAGEIGIENKGLNRWGMSFVPGKPYEGYLWVKADNPTSLYVALQSDDGKDVFAEAQLKASDGDWQRLDFTLTPKIAPGDVTDDGGASGRFAITLSQPGSILVGHAFLQPGAWGRFKGLPVRKDVAEGLLAGGFTVLRYGGSMVNADEYRWKKMIGPRDRRPPYKGTWYPYSSNGWGIIDFLNFCEAAGFLAVPDLNINETPHDISDFIEYANGPANSDWGARRVADGHPAPYGLKYIELGNEEAVNEAYWQKFRPLAEAIWATDPTVTPVVGDFSYGQRITDPFHIKGAPLITSLAAHKQILDFATAKHHAVWFDVHIWNAGPIDPDPQIGPLGLIGWLDKISPGADYKVCVFEENSNNHDMARALGHARAINELQRLGEQLPIVCCANCLQCDGQNDNGWDQGLLFLNPARTWPQPPYYVTQMIAANKFPKCVQATVQGEDGRLNVLARMSNDGKSLALQVVNIGDIARPARIHIEGYDAPADAEALELAGEIRDANTAEHPEHVTPKKRTLSHQLSEKDGWFIFRPYSFTVIRWTK
jgi:hypothetical protein